MTSAPTPSKDKSQVPLPPPTLTGAPPPLTDKMGDVVRSCVLKKFNPGKYPNPALQKHYRILQAIALDEDVPEPPEDKAVPRYGQLHKRVGPHAVEWGKTLDESVPAIEARSPPAVKKRKAINAPGEEDGDLKVKREKKSTGPISKDKLESLCEQKALMTVRWRSGWG
jgi:ATP-dependent DNA helicase 2 subunit 1